MPHSTGWIENSIASEESISGILHSKVHLAHCQMMVRGRGWQRKCHLDRGGNMICSQLFLIVRYGMDQFSNRLLCVVFPL